MDPRSKVMTLDEETVEILEIIEECKENYDLEDDFDTQYIPE